MVSKGDMIHMAYQLFDDYDADCSGDLSTSQFKKCLRQMFHEVNKSYPVDEKHLNKIFVICDQNNDGKIQRNQFIKAVEMFLQPIYNNSNKKGN